MEKLQAEAMAAAILETPLAEQKARQQARERRQVEQTRMLAEKRKVAVLSLIGMGAGATAAWLMGERISMGLLWGGLATAGVGWIVLGLLRRR